MVVHKLVTLAELQIEVVRVVRDPATKLRYQKLQRPIRLEQTEEIAAQRASISHRHGCTSTDCRFRMWSHYTPGTACGAGKRSHKMGIRSIPSAPRVRGARSALDNPNEFGMRARYTRSA